MYKTNMYTQNVQMSMRRKKQKTNNTTTDFQRSKKYIKYPNTSQESLNFYL